MLISVTLSIQGDALLPEDVTGILKVSPDVSWRKGTVRVYSSKKEIVSKFGIWEWKSNDASEKLSINDHIKRLKDTFEPVYGFLPNLPNVDRAWVDVQIVVGDDENTSSIWLEMDVEAIATLHNIGLPVVLTIDTVSSRP